MLLGRIQVVSLNIVPCSAVLLQHQPTVFSSHTTPAAASSHQPDSNVFLSHHSSSSLQHQHSEQGQAEKNRHWIRQPDSGISR